MTGRLNDPAFLRPESAKSTSQTGGVGVEWQRLDGLVSADTDHKGRWLATPPAAFTGKRLRLNSAMSGLDFISPGRRAFGMDFGKTRTTAGQYRNSSPADMVMVNMDFRSGVVGLGFCGMPARSARVRVRSTPNDSWLLARATSGR